MKTTVAKTMITALTVLLMSVGCADHVEDHIFEHRQTVLNEDLSVTKEPIPCWTCHRSNNPSILDVMDLGDPTDAKEQRNN